MTKGRRRLQVAGVVIIFVMLNYTVAVICGFGPGVLYFGFRPSVLFNLFNRYSPPPVAFAGNSDDCKATVVVATLDSPMPKAKNVIWCGTFQLAYDELKAGFGAVKAAADQEALDRLNRGRMKPEDLPEGSYYAAAGNNPGGIVEKIRREMANKFPQVKPPQLPVLDDDDQLAYAYLAASVKFQTPFFDQDQGEEFTDSAGKKTRVSSFGWYKDTDAPVNGTLARQIDLLYESYKPPEFALDLDKNSQPSQLILACVEPKETLAATWQDLRQKMVHWKPGKYDEPFSQHEPLAVPNINFKIEHRFKELELPHVAGRGLIQTFQMIDFRLDKSGAVVGSESWMHALLASHRDCSFNRPFLIVMRKRGTVEPYFVMWVDNAELLCKYGG